MLPCKMTHVFLNFVLIQQTFTLLKYRKTQHYLFVFIAFVCIFKFYVVISPPPCKLDDIYSTIYQSLTSWTAVVSLIAH